MLLFDDARSDSPGPSPDSTGESQALVHKFGDGDAVSESSGQGGIVIRTAPDMSSSYLAR